MGIIRNGYDALFCWTKGLQCLILLAARLIWGTLFAFAGWEKLTHHAETAAFFSNLGIMQPDIMAWVVGGIEFAGGICLALGFMSRIAAFLLVCVMIGAYATVHTGALTQFFSNPTAFTKEPPFLFLMASLLVLAFGPGRISVDSWLRGDSCCKGKCS